MRRRSGRDPSSLPRLAHRAPEPAAARRPPRACARPRECARDPDRRALRRPGHVQERQRHARPRRRRPAAVRGGGPRSRCIRGPSRRPGSAATNSPSVEDVDEPRVVGWPTESSGDQRAVRDRGREATSAPASGSRSAAAKRTTCSQRRPRALPGEVQGQGPGAGARAPDARGDGRADRARGALARALRNAELTLHYQPIFDSRSQRLAGVEALLRWSTRPVACCPRRVHPGRRGQPADAAPIGRWVLPHRVPCRRPAGGRACQVTR